MNPILIGTAEAISTVREDIQRMVDNEGIWIVTDTNQPGAEIPVISMSGKLYAIELSTELAPHRFLDTAVVASGPHRANTAIGHGRVQPGVGSVEPGDIHDNMKNAIELIAEERARQISVEGWTPEHDDAHSDSELARAAASYAMPGWLRNLHVRPICIEATHTLHAKIWPWEIRWWKPSEDRIRELVKAGALIAAEIDRLQRQNVADEPRGKARPYSP